MRELAGILIQELRRTFRNLPKTENQRTEADFARLSDYLAAHLTLPLTVADLAGCLQCSESTVGRVIRAHSGLSPINWINQARIQRARRLLITTRLSVSAIGGSIGIPDQFYFSKLFKKWSGEPPLAYRLRTPLL